MHDQRSGIWIREGSGVGEADLGRLKTMQAAAYIGTPRVMKIREECASGASSLCHERHAATLHTVWLRS